MTDLLALEQYMHSPYPGIFGDAPAALPVHCVRPGAGIDAGSAPPQCAEGAHEQEGDRGRPPESAAVRTLPSGRLRWRMVQLLELVETDDEGVQTSYISA